MADDMGFSDIGCYGGEIRTPNIDRLAKNGIRFKQFYNNAKCTTTRASILTGLYPRRRGPLLKQNMVTVAEVLKQAGYDTALSGKWHMGYQSPNRPSDRGFDRYFGLLDGCSNYFDPSIPDPKFKGGRIRRVFQDDKRIAKFPADFYMTGAISDYAIECIDDFTKTKRPFFLHICYTAPHYPLHAKPADIARYRHRYSAGWESLRQKRVEKQLAMGLIDPAWKIPGRDREVKSWEHAKYKDWQDLRMAVYAAMIDSMDQGIGRVVQALKKNGQFDNTVIFFLSDNGGCAEIPGGEKPERIPGPKEYYTTCGPGWAWAQNTPFRRFKSWVHEGGISTPLIVHWPGVVKPNTWNNSVAHIIDILPTCAELGKATYPRRFRERNILPMEGRSFVRDLQGNENLEPRTLKWEWAGNRAIREGDWKLCWDRKIKTWELYHIVKDRTETNDLAADFPNRVEKLSKIWTVWAKETGVRVK